MCSRPHTTRQHTQVWPPTTTHPHHHAGLGDVLWVCRQSYGGHSERETPGPIPNPEVKPFSADGTATARSWESRTPPDIHSVEATARWPLRYLQHKIPGEV